VRKATGCAIILLSRVRAYEALPLRNPFGVSVLRHPNTQGSRWATTLAIPTKSLRDSHNPTSSQKAGGSLARISHHAGRLPYSVPLLGTSSADRNPLPGHCLCQAVAHGGEKCGLDDVPRANYRFAPAFRAFSDGSVFRGSSMARPVSAAL
jgi:hypothetical protein